MSTLPSVSSVAAELPPAPATVKPRARGFVHIVRHGVGPSSIYVLTYHRLESEPGQMPGIESRPKPVLAEGAQDLIEILERIGVDFHRAEVRGALEDILRLGSANLPDLWLSDEEMLAKGLVEA